MIDCLTNFLLLVNLKLKVHISGNLEPGTYLQCAFDMNGQRIRETHLFNQCARDACKMPFGLNDLFKEQ